MFKCFIYFNRKFIFDGFVCDLVEGISFNIIEDLIVNYKLTDFHKWKRSIEEKEKSQYVKNSSSKKILSKEYVYYFCHRSFGSRISNNVRFFINFYEMTKCYLI